ncbi:MAG: hypothetical protein GX083_01775 [Clostridiales bacterium]|nr:hypothetical protein [Clostridiales bacterium]
MIKIIILICSIVSILFALMLSAWIQRKRTIDNETIKLLYNIMRDRSSAFIKSEYIALAASAVPVILLIAVYSNWVGSVFFAAGIIFSLPIIVLGIDASNRGSLKASLKATKNDIPGALRASFRTGSIMGFLVSGFGLLFFSLIFIFFKYAFINKYVLYYAFGAVFVSLFISVSGRTYSKASNLCSDDEFIDNTGAIAGAGADFYAVFVCSIATAISLADVAVNTGGVTSTFTQLSSSIFPMVVAGMGILASIIGSLFYKGTNKKNNARDITIVNLLSGFLVIIAAAYFSNDLMQSYRYAYAVGSGIIAGVLAGIVTEQYAYDNNKFKKTYDKLSDEEGQVHLIRDFTFGSHSTIAMTIVLCTALVVAYNFANIYGVALAAVGFVSIFGTSASPEIYSSVLANLSNITEDLKYEEDVSIKIILGQAENKVSAVSRGYSQISMSLTGISALLLFTYLTDKLTIDFVTQLVMAGIFTGAMIAFFYTSVLTNSILRIANYDTAKSGNAACYDRISVSIKGLIITVLFSTVGPIAIGVLLGLNFLIGVLFGLLVVGMLLNSLIANSGRNLRNASGISLNTIINVMLIVSVTFAALLIKFEGLFTQII